MQHENTIGEFVSKLSQKEKALFYKLWELVKRGVDGEQENAKRLIGLFCEKRGSKWELLENTSDVSKHIINGVKNKEIFQHVIAKVLDTWTPIYWTVPRKSGKFYVECTPEQAVEIEILTDIYQKAYNRELRKLRIAFLFAHSLYPKTKQQTQDEDDIVEMSEKDVKKFMEQKRKQKEQENLVFEAGLMANAISGVKVNKRLQSGSND